jgi:glycosyltransferase involved in cell wall biosynthesis
VIDVSVVVPTHNRLHLVQTAIASILNQQGVTLELIVVNDGSSDGTGPWLDRLAAQNSRVKVIHHERPRYMSSARNAGIAQASARWVAFCDDDDLWSPDKLVAQLKALRSNSVRWSCTGVAVVDDKLDVIGHHRVKGGGVLPDLLRTNIIPTGSSVVAELSLLREVAGFDEGLHGSEDWDLWIRLSRRSRLAAVDRPLIAYRLGPCSMSMQVERMRTGRAVIVARYAQLAAAYGATPDEASHERYLAKQLLRAGEGRNAAAIFARLAMHHGRWRELPRVAAAVVAPRLTDAVGRARAAAAVPSGWRAEAEAWLSRFRSPQTAGLASRASMEDAGEPGWTLHP